MTFTRSLLIVATCLAVLLAAPAACFAEACVDTADSCCVTEAHGGGPQAVLKPLSSSPPPVEAAPASLVSAPIVAVVGTTPPDAAPSSVVPLRI